MINETLLVNEYLEGKNITPEILYRVCYILTKWFREQGISDRVEIRQNIFDWANKNKIFIDFNLNGCINNAFNDSKRLTNNVVLKINHNDVEEIKKRFDYKKTRRVALAILAYAKIFADSNNEFYLSHTAFGNWLGIHYTNIGRRYLSELIDYGYIEITNKGDTKSVWGGKARTSMVKYKINVSIKNSGEFIMDDNNIDKLYHEIFA